MVYVLKSFDMGVEDGIRDKNISYKSLRIGVQSSEHTHKTSCSRFVHSTPICRWELEIRELLSTGRPPSQEYTAQQQ